MSGWEIYNASPLFDFRFPPAITLGGWLGGAIGWHLALMWLLALNGLCYLLWSLFSGHFRHDLLPLRLSALRRDIWLTLTLRLQHRHGKYNAIQKLMYLGVLLLGLLLVLSGLAIWKPVQLSWLVALFGGFDTARYVHFFAMTCTITSPRSTTIQSEASWPFMLILPYVCEFVDKNMLSVY